jgi:hypothetical protein
VSLYRQPPAGLDDLEGLADTLALRHERRRAGCVELEHVVVAGDDQLGSDRVRQAGRFRAAEQSAAIYSR